MKTKRYKNRNPVNRKKTDRRWLHELSHEEYKTLAKLKNPPLTREHVELVRQYIRQASVFWKEKDVAMNNAKIGKNMYLCSACCGIFKRDEVSLDHIEPVVPVETGFTTADSFVFRSLCPNKSYQVMCKLCHNKKTKEETQLRAVYRKKRKSNVE